MKRAEIRGFLNAYGHLAPFGDEIFRSLFTPNEVPGDPRSMDYVLDDVTGVSPQFKLGECEDRYFMIRQSHAGEGVATIRAHEISVREDTVLCFAAFRVDSKATVEGGYKPHPQYRFSATELPCDSIVSIELVVHVSDLPMPRLNGSEGRQGEVA